MLTVRTWIGSVFLPINKYFTNLSKYSKSFWFSRQTSANISNKRFCTISNVFCMHSTRWLKIILKMVRSIASFFALSDTHSVDRISMMWNAISSPATSTVLWNGKWKKYEKIWTWGNLWNNYIEYLRNVTAISWYPWWAGMTKGEKKFYELEDQN